MTRGFDRKGRKRYGPEQDARTETELGDEFFDRLARDIDPALSGFIDPFMSEEAVRLAALIGQQHLAVQALSIANSRSSDILSLFRPSKRNPHYFDYPPTGRLC